MVLYTPHSALLIDLQLNLMFSELIQLESGLEMISASRNQSNFFSLFFPHYSPFSDNLDKLLYATYGICNLSIRLFYEPFYVLLSSDILSSF